MTRSRLAPLLPLLVPSSQSYQISISISNFQFKFDQGYGHSYRDIPCRILLYGRVDLARLDFLITTPYRSSESEETINRGIPVQENPGGPQPRARINFFARNFFLKGVMSLSLKTRPPSFISLFSRPQKANKERKKERRGKRARAGSEGGKEWGRKKGLDPDPIVKVTPSVSSQSSEPRRQKCKVMIVVLVGDRSDGSGCR